MSGDLYFDEYNPSHAATDGWVHSTNHTGNSHSVSEYVSNGSISSYGYNEVWFNWTGDYGVDQYAIDFNNINDDSSATSISQTSSYTSGTHISLYDIMKSKGYRIGDTIYCWVSCKIGNTWTKTYLGTITPQRRGGVFYKNGNNYKDCTSMFIKNTALSGGKKNIKYVLYKNGNTYSLIDVLTDLYN